MNEEFKRDDHHTTNEPGQQQNKTKTRKKNQKDFSGI